MAIAADEEDVDLGQDYRQPDEVTAPQRVQISQPAPVVAPGAAPIRPPAPAFDPEAVDRNVALRRLLNSMGDAPIAEAEQAVATAMKYQAIRGYQRDLANGIPAHDALAKWAPSMFSQSKGGTLGQAASLARAMRPEPEKYMDIGGVGYQMKGGKATPLTPPKVVKPKTVPLVLPADPENPLTGGHVTVQLDESDPLVKKTLERARQGPPAPPPPEPGIIDRVKEFFGGAKTPQAASPPVAPLTAPSPAAAATLPASPVRAPRPTTPEEKLAAARALRSQHPDWTKKQILDAVNQ